MDEDSEAITRRSDSETKRASADEMDEKRHQDVAYEYLCRLEEAKIWIESCINEELPSTTELEENLRNGVYLAKLGNYICPQEVPLKKIYDSNQTYYKVKGLHFRHTDNINFWIKAMKFIGMPQLVFPEITDVYEKKNMPRLIYCLHALSLFLHNRGKAPKMENLYGKVEFTEEEISAMSSELLKCGIQIPAFNTIGGVLTQNVSIDEAAQHAGVIAINEAIERQIDKEILNAIMNPNVNLSFVDSSNIHHYIEELFDAKVIKSSKADFPDVAEVCDAYDKLLTKDEIQKCLNHVNFNKAILNIKLAVDKKDSVMLINALEASCLRLLNVISQNAVYYIEELQRFCRDQDNNNLVLEKYDIQNIINKVNEKIVEQEKRMSAVAKINHAIVSDDEEELVRALTSEEAQMSAIEVVASRLYLLELKSKHEALKRDLTYDEVKLIAKATTALVSLNFCVDFEEVEVTFELLKKNETDTMHIDFDCRHNYLTALSESKKQKKNNEECPFLTSQDVQECVTIVNSLANEKNERIAAIQRLNDILKDNNLAIILHELSQPILGLQNVKNENAELYYWNFVIRLNDKLRENQNSDDVALWIDEIQDIINDANELSSRALKCCNLLAKIRSSLVNDDFNLYRDSILNADIGLTRLIDSCMETYFHKMKDYFSSETDLIKQYAIYKEDNLSITFFYDLVSECGNWHLNDSITENFNCITKEIIQDIIFQSNELYDIEVLKKSLEPLMINFQAHVRGFLKRQEFEQRLIFFEKQECYIIKIQSWWRGCKERKKYLACLNYWKSNVKSIKKVQSFVRMFLARNRFKKRLKHFKENENAVLKIQRYWRANKTRKAFKEIMTSVKPSFSSVQMFVHLLDIKYTDFSEELSFHKLHSEIVKAIRENQRLEQDLSVMDIKIGLLVKNRITLQDVVAHGKKLNKKSKEDGESIQENATTSKSFVLNKEHQTKIEAYEHLFYLLQSNPHYLSKLIFLIQQSKDTKFIESVILTVFNYASNHREEYLLLKLYRTALHEEIMIKLDKPSDIVIGNPLIIKMIVGFSRNKSGENALREIIGPSVKQVLNNSDLKLSTNPVEIYKSWINQLESQTGQPSNLPYNVEQEVALQHDEVIQQIQSSVEALKSITLIFLNSIMNSLHKIPYGILYMTKVLKSCLETKFPNVSKKEIYKVVGNVLYYRYINPAIVSPDAFNIVDIGGGATLNQEQRRNLASIAKLLQFATSKTGFGPDSPHLVCLNPFIIDCHEKFKVFFQAACEVEELESHFKIEEYSESLIMIKPTIYISCQEICELHKLLLEHEFVISPDPNDPLHELLEDLGEKPNSDTLFGKSDICLHLSNKFPIEESRTSDMDQLYVVTKQMIVDVMHCVTGKSISEILLVQINDEMNATFARHLAVKQQLVSEKEDVNKTLVLCSGNLTLEETIKKIRHNLNLLESENYVSPNDDYQNIVNTIALDIRNRRDFRKQRKRDLLRMKTTLDNLIAKRKFCEEQVDYYDLYIKECLKNMGPEKKAKMRKKLKSRRTLKYNGVKLYEKGIIKDIDGLAKNQYKNILFEISPTDVDGSFAVKVKYMGTNLADFKIDIQSLLEYQYEGIPVMKMFDRANVNVNLLLYLLNTKFYGQVK